MKKKKNSLANNIAFIVRTYAIHPLPSCSINRKMGRNSSAFLLLIILNALFPTYGGKEIDPESLFADPRTIKDSIGKNLRMTLELNVVVVGQSGSGKTSCINSLFDENVIPKKAVVRESTIKPMVYRQTFSYMTTDIDLVRFKNM